MLLNIQIDIIGKPHAKARPRWDSRSRRIYTPSTKYEIEFAKSLLPWKGKLTNEEKLAVCCFFYGANPSADGDNLWKFCLDALVRANVIDDDRFIIYGSFEKRGKEVEGNPFPGKPSTRINLGRWD